MLFINGEIVPGLEQGKITAFGTETVSGTAEIARTNWDLGQDRFTLDRTIPIIGEENIVRIIGSASKTAPNMLDYIRMMAPPGLITFGVPVEEAAQRKAYGTHLAIILREWGMGNGPRVPFLGAAIEGVYDDQRQFAIDTIQGAIGSRAISMSCLDDQIHIATL